MSITEHSTFSDIKKVLGLKAYLTRDQVKKAEGLSGRLSFTELRKALVQAKGEGLGPDLWPKLIFNPHEGGFFIPNLDPTASYQWTILGTGQMQTVTPNSGSNNGVSIFVFPDSEDAPPPPSSFRELPFANNQTGVWAEETDPEAFSLAPFEMNGMIPSRIIAKLSNGYSAELQRDTDYSVTTNSNGNSTVSIQLTPRVQPFSQAGTWRLKIYYIPD